MNTEPTSPLAAVVQSRLVRLGRDFTQVHMDEKSRRDAVESAHWRTCSPHEWSWTPDQQANMALYCLWAAQRLEMLSELASGKQVIHEPNALRQPPLPADDSTNTKGAAR